MLLPKTSNELPPGHEQPHRWPSLHSQSLGTWGQWPFPAVHRWEQKPFSPSSSRPQSTASLSPEEMQALGLCGLCFLCCLNGSVSNLWPCFKSYYLSSYRSCPSDLHIRKESGSGKDQPQPEGVKGVKVASCPLGADSMPGTSRVSPLCKINRK